MKVRGLALAAALAAGLGCLGLAAPDCASAVLDERKAAPIEGRDRGVAPTRAAAAKEPRARLGQKTWKERINTVARHPLRHDLDAIDSADRVEWEHGEGPWRGIRDFRPIIARTTHGFGPKTVRKTRFERVMTISRGPIQGPGFTE